MLEALYDIENLYESFEKVYEASGWKTRTQRYKEDVLLNLVELRDKLIAGIWRPKAPWVFIVNERGKLRVIESYSMEDRIVQRCLVQYVLLPVIRPKLIYDNDASLTERGTSHFRNRLWYKLNRFAKLHGNKGYALVGDFSKFFDNIQHEKLMECLKELGIDDETLDFVKMILDAHQVDVSYLSDEEYADCMNVVFDNIQYQTIDKSLLTGEKMMPKGTGIGSHLAQLAGVVLPYKLDNYIKIVKGVKDYARYNDDWYIIHESKEFLVDLLEDIYKICERDGIFLNKNKTHITPLRRGFTILKTKYFITDDKQVVAIPKKSVFTRERKKLRGLKRRLDNGLISIEKIQGMYKSWRASIIQRGYVNESVKSVDGYFQKQFGIPYDFPIPKEQIEREEIFNW